MKTLLNVTKALSDPSRVRLLCALREGELCVCQLVELLQLAPSTVSKHLSILHQADLVESRKQGRWVYYRLPGKTAPDLSRKMTKHALRAVEKDPAVVEDNKRLKQIRTADLEELCRRYDRAS